ATVGALLFDRDGAADRLLLDRVEGLADLALAGGYGVVVTVVGGVAGDDGGLDLVDRLVALELALGGDRVDQRLAVRSADVGEQALVELRRVDLVLLFARFLL